MPAPSVASARRVFNVWMDCYLSLRPRLFILICRRLETGPDVAHARCDGSYSVTKSSGPCDCSVDACAGEFRRALAFQDECS